MSWIVDMDPPDDFATKKDFFLFSFFVLCQTDNSKHLTFFLSNLDQGKSVTLML